MVYPRLSDRECSRCRRQTQSSASYESRPATVGTAYRSVEQCTRGVKHFLIDVKTLGSFRLRGEHAHVIHEHRRGENRVRLRIAVEVSADREIQDHKVRLIEHRLATLLYLGAREVVVDVIVDKEAHVRGIALDHERMEVV